MSLTGSFLNVPKLPDVVDKDIKTVRISHLVKKFGDFTAVNDISFEVCKGEIFGFLGANGAGKTTAMRILCGLSRPTSGQGDVAGTASSTGRRRSSGTSAT